MTTPEATDLAQNLVALAGKLDALSANARQYALGLIAEWATADTADRLVAVLEATIDHVRANRPSVVVDGATK
ncbi:MAG TPA: hypothetical protein VM677_07775 [Actinokineospora sp.]|nr:hypothetical protein [Actinokineospora sp.]